MRIFWSGVALCGALVSWGCATGEEPTSAGTSLSEDDGSPGEDGAQEAPRNQLGVGSSSATVTLESDQHAIRATIGASVPSVERSSQHYRLRLRPLGLAR